MYNRTKYESSSKELDFNTKQPTVIHIDLNSCFATIEQQANPLLRGKPTVVAAYDSPNGCILAASVEAKKLGIKTGMRVKEGKEAYRKLVVLKPDPWKYRNVHLSLRKLLSHYTADFQPKSIDEFVLNLEGYPAFSRGLVVVSSEIKRRIKEEIGDFLTVSIGIAPNRFLAKLASNFQKPDGLTEINKDNYLEHFGKIKLTDLPYIKDRNAMRLANMGIFSVMDFYRSPLWKLKAAFESINSYYWYLRLRGFEIDDVLFGRRSYGNSYSLPRPMWHPQELSPVLTKIVTKMAARVRHAGYKAHGVHLAVMYRDGKFWHKGISFSEPLFDTRDILRVAYKLLTLSSRENTSKSLVHNLAISCFGLVDFESLQLSLFDDLVKKEKLNRYIDRTNRRWGDFVVVPGRMIGTGKYVPDRIAFGGIKELEEFTFGSDA